MLSRAHCRPSSNLIPRPPSVTSFATISLQTSDQSGAILKDPGVLLKDPGVLSKDPGILLKDPGVLGKDPGVL